MIALAIANACCGCSAITDASNLLVRCEVPDGGTDPCAAVGLVCMDGSCQACKPVAEICDGRDNDCDGKVDEGLDPDMDGFTWCGGGRVELADCAPMDPTVHPPGFNPDGSPRPGLDPCDGKDNDCDGKIDEDSNCEMLHTCAQMGCPSGLTCDAKSDQCIAPRTSGSLCKSDSECGDGFCISTSALGLSQVLADNLCGTACCRDHDCPQGSVCVQPGSGARVCLPLEIAGRQLSQAGDTCRQSSDCASGVCQRNKCVSTCSKDSDCQGETCRLNVLASSLLSGAGAWICGSSGGRGASGDLCTSFDPTSCQSALCFGVQCAGPCGSNADCGSGTGLECRYVAVQGLLGGGRVTACIQPSSAQASASPRTCCTNADCASGESCRPMQTGRDWGMYCASAGPQ